MMMHEDDGDDGDDGDDVGDDEEHDGIMLNDEDAFNE